MTGAGRRTAGRKSAPKGVALIACKVRNQMILWTSRRVTDRASTKILARFLLLFSQRPVSKSVVPSPFSSHCAGAGRRAANRRRPTLICMSNEAARHFRERSSAGRSDIGDTPAGGMPMWGGCNGPPWTPACVRTSLSLLGRRRKTRSGLRKRTTKGCSHLLHARNQMIF